APGLSTVWLLHLDDLGTQPCQGLRARRACLELGEVENLDPFQRRCRSGCGVLVAHYVSLRVAVDASESRYRCAGERAAHGPFDLSSNQLCQRNCCGLRAESCEMTTLTRAGPRKSIASSRAPRRSFGSST